MNNSWVLSGCLSLESRHTNQLCSISKCDSNSLLNEVQVQQWLSSISRKVKVGFAGCIQQKLPSNACFSLLLNCKLWLLHSSDYFFLVFIALFSIWPSCHFISLCWCSELWQLWSVFCVYAHFIFLSLISSVTLQISRASSTPESSYIAKPAASWLDDFLVWISPEAFGCCRKYLNGSYCPPDDQVGAYFTCLTWKGICCFCFWDLSAPSYYYSFRCFFSLHSKDRYVDNVSNLYLSIFLSFILGNSFTFVTQLGLLICCSFVR